MADVDLHIGGHVYTLSCADGEEADLQRLAGLVDAEVARARSLVGGMTEARQLLFAAIFLAERVGIAAEPAETLHTASLAQLADRIERAGARLAQLAEPGA